MTKQEYMQKSNHPTEENYIAFIHFCINFDIDWMNESFEECKEKTLTSMEMLTEEIEQAENPIEAHDILCQRLEKLSQLRKSK